MKLRNIAVASALVVSLAGLAVDANAQSCSAGTTTVSTSTSTTFLFGASNQCVQITGVGSITVGSSQDGIAPNNYSFYSNLGVNNQGTITVGAGSAYGIETLNSSFSSIVNAGSILGGSGYSYGINNTSTITTINNSGSISVGNIGILNQSSSSITTLTNSGTIFGNSNGISNAGTITTINNSTSGVITGNSSDAIYNYAARTINTIANFGVIQSNNNSAFGISNAGYIVTLNNAQGGNSSALTFNGRLPTNYNIVINSSTSYGQLAVGTPTGATAFGIYAGSTITTKSYTGVLQGLTSSNVGATRTGSYDGLSWRLALENGSSTVWDLTFTGGSTQDTQASLVNTASALQNTFALQNAVISNSFSYDCNVFGENDVCVSAGGRNTAVSAANGLNNTSGLLIAAYRPHPNYRIGAYADQNLSVNNAGSTVNLGNNTPLVGIFGVWSENLDGTGTEVKVSAAYGQKNTTITRAVVGTSEAGSGGAPINSQGAQVAAKYGFAVAENTIVSPYVGIRYTQNNMNGYTEGASGSVTAPLTYSALNTNATTVLAGLGAQYRFIPQATVFASVGVESDTKTSNGTYSATGVDGLTPINFNANPVKTRATASLGAYYDVEKNQRLGVTGIYRQEAYQAVSTTTVMATYIVGF